MADSSVAVHSPGDSYLILRQLILDLGAITVLGKNKQIKIKTPLPLERHCTAWFHTGSKQLKQISR